MEKKFLDKQGLAELNKSFKDEFASKGDVEKISNFMSKMSFEEQKKYWIKKIESEEEDGIFDYMLIRGKYCPNVQFTIDSNCIPTQSLQLFEVQQKTFDCMRNTTHQVTVETSYFFSKKIDQLAYNSSRSIIASRSGDFIESAPSDKDLIDILNQSNDIWSLYDQFKITWSPWKVSFNVLAQDLPFVPNDSKPYGLLSKEDKQKLDNMTSNGTIKIIDDLYHQDAKSALSANQGYILQKTKVDKVDGKQLSTEDYTKEDKAKLIAMPVPVFFEKEQYDKLSEKEKMDNSKLYYIYAERQ